MQVHDGAGGRPLCVHRQMQEIFLGGFVSGEQLARVVHFRKRRRVKPPKAGIGRRHQPAVGHTRADIARTTESEATVEKRLAEVADLFAQLRFAHDYGCTSNALVKKSGAPKLPDMSASASAGSPMLNVHGTPGSISGPMYRPRTPRALTTAPEVSPPATTNLRTPSSTRPVAMRDSVCSISSPACSRPRRFWIDDTCSGEAVE